MQIGLFVIWSLVFSGLNVPSPSPAPRAAVQPAPDLEAAVQAVVAAYQGAALEKSYGETQGKIAYPGKEAVDFTLTFHTLYSRLEVADADGGTVVIRRGNRSQAARKGAAEPSTLSSFSSSAANLIPVLVLIQLHANPNYRGSILMEEGGAPALCFIESPLGLEESPYLRNRLVATFRLDSRLRITSLEYVDTRGSLPRALYRYSHDAVLKAPYLQPFLVELETNGQLRFRAFIASQRLNVTASPELFRITE
jgi:hypothetical protein